MKKQSKAMGTRLLALLMVATTLAYVGCSAKDDCRWIRQPKADFVMLGRDYSIVVFTPEFMSEVLGSTWKEQQLYYAFDRAVDPMGEPIAVSVSFFPIAKGRRIIELSGSDWEDIHVYVYSLDTQQGLTLALNLRVGTVRVLVPRGAWRGRPTLAEDGSLHLGYQ